MLGIMYTENGERETEGESNANDYGMQAHTFRAVQTPCKHNQYPNKPAF